jgi:glycyl-tRNA synthetase
MAEPKENSLMEKIVSLCKRRGFIYQSSEIYGGINGFWDYGPLGTELKRNVRELWWRSLTQEREDVVGLDATIIMHPQIWRASGHTDTFADPMSTCRHCKKLVRTDQVWDLFEDGPLPEWLARVQHECETKQSCETLHGWAVGKLGKLLPGSALARDWASVVAEANQQLAALGRFELRPFFILLAKGRWEPDGPPPCPYCGGELTEPRRFNLMFQTHVGPVADEENVAYLRPETAQAIFVQFKNVLETSRQKVPFGICQIGKAFRNEVTPRNFTFRSREFEQMELEFFIRPDEAIEAISGSVATVTDDAPLGRPQPSWGWQAWHKYWVEERLKFYESIGLPRAKLAEYWQKPEELAHYAKATVDILFAFPFGPQELEGVAARGDFDLSQHQKFSAKPMDYFDEELKAAWAKLDDAKKHTLFEQHFAAQMEALRKKGVAEAEAKVQAESETKGFFERLAKGNYVPHVIEPSAGVDRLVLALICHAYTEDEVPDEKGQPEGRVVMKFHPRIAPIKVGVFPLLKNRPELVKKAREVRDLLRPHMAVFYDEAGAIGRRYRRQDEAGTPFGVTIDFDTLGERPELKDTVTLRDRDTCQQVRVRIDELVQVLREKIR